LPAGNVQFLDGTTPLGIGALNGQGVGTYTTNSLTAGSHTIAAVYSGDANFAGSTSAQYQQTVTAPDFSITANPSSLTLLAGQTGTVTFTFVPVGGFKGTVNLGCSGLPTGVTCTFDPTSLTADGSNKTQTSILTIQTQGPNKGTVSMLRLDGGRPALLRAAPFFFPAAFFGAWLAWQRKKLHSATRGMLLLGVVAFFVAGAIGCGGYSGPRTAAGTTTVKITATTSGSGSATSQTAQFTLVITD
jgi:hypothetical protein